ncbi:cell wall hydrolase [Metabacillus endolithicus]|nr:cell wall hydrolase [Metabacillus endolithicus]
MIYQRNQFQPVANGQINKPADEESRKAVFAALSDMRYSKRCLILL